MTAIDVGLPAIDRAATGGAGVTWISLDNPLNANGTITGVEVYVNTAGNFKVGLFANAGEGIWYCRTVADLGYLTTGYHAISGVSLVGQTGDYIGYYSLIGKLDRDNLGYVGTVYVNSDVATQNEYFSPTSAGGYGVSINGAGDTGTPSPIQSAVNETMDYVLEEIMPAVSNWWADHFFLRENPDYVTAFLYHMLITALSGTGSGVSLADLQAELDTRIKVSTVQPADGIEDIRYDIGVNQAPATGIMAALIEMDTHLPGNLDPTTQELMDQIVYESNAIQSLTSSQTVTLSNNIAGLNNLSAGTVTTIVNAARDHIEGDPPTDLHTISDKIDGIGTPDLSGIYTAITNAQNNVNDHTDGAVSAGVSSVKGSGSPDIAAVMAALAGLETGSPVGYPGPSGVTFGTPVAFSNAMEITATMDGVLVTLSSVPAGVGKHQLAGRTSYQHAGWLAFVASDDAADELQWINLDKAAYIPKRLSQPASLLFFPRAGISGTITPFVLGS